jgi:hypothetical protein
MMRQEITGMKGSLVELVADSANRVIAATTAVPPVAMDEGDNPVPAPNCGYLGHGANYYRSSKIKSMIAWPSYV